MNYRYDVGVDTFVHVGEFGIQRKNQKEIHHNKE